MMDDICLLLYWRMKDLYLTVCKDSKGEGMYETLG